LSNINEVQNSIMDELNNLTFVKDNAQKLMERKVSFERQREKKPAVGVLRVCVCAPAARYWQLQGDLKSLRASEGLHERLL